MPTNPSGTRTGRLFTGWTTTANVDMSNQGPTQEQIEAWREEERRQQMEMEIARQSVLSPYHPVNDGRFRERDEAREFVFRPRIPKKILPLTLGWELEANREAIKVPKGVEQIGDGSVNGAGAEYVVLPAVTKSPNYVLGMLKDLVHAPKLNTDESCGFHIHVSTPKLSLPKMRQWALAVEHLAMKIEDDAFNAVPDSRKGNNYCRRISPIYAGHRFVSSKYNNERRYHWLNTVEMFRPNGIHTIENRLLGHTHRWKYLLAWVLFTMELAQRGYALQYSPFNADIHVEHLKRLLKLIATEIKPLSKKSLPTPQWIYDGLRKFGVDSTRWDRPLAKLYETEANLKGLVTMAYSDDQPEIPSHNDDEDYCPCGCETEGRCSYQIHDDGDCSRNDCERCHENGECDGTPHCESCMYRAHSDGEDCRNASCERCEQIRIDNGVTATEANASTNTRATPRRTRRTVRATPVRVNPVSASPSAAAIRAVHDELVTLTNVTIDRAALQAMQMAPIVYVDEAGQTIPDSTYFGRSVPEMLRDQEMTIAQRMLDQHEEALTANREMTYNSGCGPDCRRDHYSDICVRCNRDWGYHSGHYCMNHYGHETRERGSFAPRGAR